jgi:hypothetical protein
MLEHVVSGDVALPAGDTHRAVRRCRRPRRRRSRVVDSATRLHSGDADTRVRDYFGPRPAVRYCCRLLLSAATALVMDQLPDGATHRDLGSIGSGCVPSTFPAGLSGPPPRLPAAGDAQPNNLPVQASFVAEMQEVNKIRQRLTEETVRLQTPTGPGGTGKPVWRCGLLPS